MMELSRAERGPREMCTTLCTRMCARRNAMYSLRSPAGRCAKMMRQLTCAPTMSPPHVTASLMGDKDLEPLKRFEWLRQSSDIQRQFLQGHKHVRIAYFKERHTSNQFGCALRARVWLGEEGCEGPPGHAHGGSTAAVLDEAMGFCCWANGFQVLTSSMNVRYHAPLPLSTDVDLHAQIVNVDGRKVLVEARLSSVTGARTYTSAAGTFKTLKDGFAAHLRGIASSSARK